MVVISRLLLPVSLVAFVGLGISDGILGTGWPSIRDDYGRPLGDLGLVIAVAIAGYVILAATNGVMARRMSLGLRLVLAYGSMVAGATTVAAGRAWPAMLAGVALIGAGEGILDPSINAHVGRNHGMASMNLLHAGFGIGATLGPFVMVWALAGSGGWRVAYSALGVWAGAMLAFMLAIRRSWPPAAPISQPLGRRLARQGVVMALGAFFLSTGMEVSVGAWAFSWLFDGRGSSRGVAAALTALYWGGFTVSRLAGAAIGDRSSPSAMLRASAVMLIGGLGWMAADVGATGGAGLPIAGAGIGLVFPILVASTVRRFGSSGDAVVGWGFAASSLGAASLPWLVGQVAERHGFGWVGVVLLLVAAAVAAVAVWATATRAEPVGA